MVVISSQDGKKSMVFVGSMGGEKSDTGEGGETLALTTNMLNMCISLP